MSTWLSPAYGGPLTFRPDYDAIEALSSEREALWSRVDKATFLTQNEKRAAVGYGPLNEDLAQKFNPHHDALGRFTFGPNPDAAQPAQGRRFFGRFPTAKPPKGPGFGATPKGLQFTEHGRSNATQRNFSEQRIDAIVENNAKSRIGKVDEYGKKTWEYTDARGNTVVLNEQGGIVTVFSPAPKGIYIEKP